MLTDTATGYLILGIALLLILGLVFAISSRPRPAADRPHPPRGVHLPGPSFLPVVLAIGGSLIGAGLAFRPDGWIANPWLAVPGLLVFCAGVFAWVTAANREWRETEQRPHDDEAAH